MTASKMIVLAITVVALLAGTMCLFTVKETELALMLRFGKVVSADFEPGLHFKIPIYHTIRKFDKRIQTLDAKAEHFLTSEKKNLIVDSFIKWKITDVITYYIAVGGSARTANTRLTVTIADGLRSEFGKRTIKEVVSGDRAEIMDIITTEAIERAKQFGIQIVDVRIKRIELPTEVSSSVYRRMEAERERDARKLRSMGEAEAVRIRATADKERVEVVALAERDSNQTRGEGDAIAADTYALAYNQNPEFYALYRSLNAYKEVFNNRSDMLIIQPNSDFFRYFKDLNGVNSKYPPQVPQVGEIMGAGKVPLVQDTPLVQKGDNSSEETVENVPTDKKEEASSLKSVEVSSEVSSPDKKAESAILSLGKEQPNEETGSVDKSSHND
jgi:membrane protease subunit HflC